MLFDFGESIWKIFVGIFLLIDGIIYGFIDKCYQLFMALASARILSNDAIQTFANRVYIIVGVVMLFVLSYSILSTIVNPDNTNKGNSGAGKILQKIVIAVISLAVVPSVFNFLYRIQDVMLSQNVIGKIILGGFESKANGQTITGATLQATDAEGNVTGSFSAGTYTFDETEAVYEAGGKNLAVETFTPFFQPLGNPDEITAHTANYVANPTLVSAGGWLCAASLIGSGVATVLSAGGASIFLAASVGHCIINRGVAAANTVSDILSGRETSYTEVMAAAAGGDWHLLSMLAENVVNNEIDYTFIISSIVGAFIVYVLVSFCLDLGVRAAKLAYFQMIAPIPILMNILPKGDKVFSTWTKKTVNTFLEVFIRVLIIYFVIYLIATLPDLTGDFWVNPFSNSQVILPSSGVKLFAKVFIILGLIVFAKQAPKLISEMFGIDGGGIKLGIREKLADAGVMRGAAAIGGGLQTAVRNFNNQKGWRRFTSAAAGLGSGAVRGFNGAKDAKTFSAMNKARAEAVAKAEARRNQRTERRNYLNTMTDEDGNQVGWLEARAINARDNIKSWAGRGPSTAAYDMYDKIQKQEKAIKDATAEIFSKYDKKDFLINMARGDFKGDNADAAFAMYQRYIEGYGMSYKEAEARLKQMQAENMSGRSEAEQVQHARDVQAMESMLAQLKKNSILKLETDIYNNRNATDLRGTVLDGVKIDEVRDISSKINVFADEFNRSGINTSADGNTTINFNAGDAGKSSDDIATEMGRYKTKISREIERQKQREAATKGDKK